MVELVREDIFKIEKKIDLVSFFESNLSFIRSISQIEEYLKSQRIKLNGILVNTNQILNVGDEITLLTPQSKEPVVNKNIQILYEDEYILAINKPANLPVHPAGKYYFNTLTHILKEIGYDSVKPINRLDKETSGIVMLGKTDEIVIKLGKLFTNKSVKKEYFAICFGEIKENLIIDEPLLKTCVGEIRNHVIVDVEGKPSITKIEPLKHNSKFSLLKINLVTGRSHQIRSHLAYIKHPIVGDKQYGLYPDLFVRHTKGENVDEEIMNKLLATRQLLHCYKIEFKHPITNEAISIKAPLPEDMEKFIDYYFSSLNHNIYKASPF